jgi:N-acetyl-anhydromuramyl-L-alanine amidase AmpD
MGSRRTRLVLLACATAAAVVASAASAGLRVLVARSPNRTDSNRTAATIDSVVVHVTEGRFTGSVRWLRNWRSRGSAHFVVSRNGEIVQLVSVTDVAWHSGNNYWNRHSIGIEHEGWTARGGFTDAEYRASAQLVAYLSLRYGIPLDRRHIIGHDEVPDPYHRGRYGGAGHHLDPGRHWNWTKYMTLVREYARDPQPPVYVDHLAPVATAPANAETLAEAMARAAAASVPRAEPKPAPKPEATPEPAPARAPAAAPEPAPKPKPAPAPVHVAPKPKPKPAPRVPVAPKRSVVDRGATVHGSALWWSGVTLHRKWHRHIYKVEFSVDGHVLYTDNTWPFSFHRHEGWDSRTVANGSHLLVVHAYGTHHYRARKTFKIRVANPPMQLAVSGAASGGTVGGLARIGVDPSERVERVALVVDGKPVSRDLSAPYELVWDTAAVPEGRHTLLVWARGRGGRIGRTELDVVVANAKDFPKSLSGDWSSGGATP